MDEGQVIKESARQNQNGDGQDQANEAVSHKRDYIKEKGSEWFSPLAAFLLLICF
jgi:hypothetical protein